MRPRDRSMLARVAGRIREDRPFGNVISWFMLAIKFV